VPRTRTRKWPRGAAGRRDGDEEKAAVGGVAGSSLMAYAGAFVLVANHSPRWPAAPEDKPSTSHPCPLYPRALDFHPSQPLCLRGRTQAPLEHGLNHQIWREDTERERERERERENRIRANKLGRQSTGPLQNTAQPRLRHLHTLRKVGLAFTV
jgi:hypothetical protein